MSTLSLPTYYSMTIADDKGYVSSSYNMYNDQFWQTANVVVNYFNDGVVIPSKSSLQIVALQPGAAVGTLWFNVNLAKLQVKTAPGVVETITSA